MSVSPIRDRRAERLEATRREILDVAWELVRTDGLGGLSMRDLGARVGLRAQSLYVYFPSKHAIYDAMFADANRDLLDRRRALDPPGEPRRRCANWPTSSSSSAPRTRCATSCCSSAPFPASNRRSSPMRWRARCSTGGVEYSPA